MKSVLLMVFLFSTAFALQKNDKLFECNEIFQERKSELLVELERIDEQKQALSALKTATEELLRKKAQKLQKQEQEVDAKLDKLKKEQENLAQMIKQKQELLASLKSTKMDRVAQTFAKMKPGSSANILSNMQVSDAVKILQSLQPKVVGKILAKMDPQKASQITQHLSN